MLFAIERSRKRHKSDNRATLAKRRALPALPSVTTPLSSLSSSTALDPPDSDDEDNLNLPVIKLPGTPIAETEMETEEGGATGVSITPETVTQRTKAKKDAVGVASDKEGGASKRRSGRQSAGAGAPAGENEKKQKSSHQSGKGVTARKGKANSAEKETKTVSKKRGRLMLYYNLNLAVMSCWMFSTSFTEADVFKPEGIKGHQEDSSHKEKPGITPKSSVNRHRKC